MFLTDELFDKLCAVVQTKSHELMAYPSFIDVLGIS